MTVGVKHIGRVLLGMSQYARAHVQHPEQYPWYFTSGNLASATVLLNALEECPVPLPCHFCPHRSQRLKREEQLVTAEGPGLTWMLGSRYARECLCSSSMRAS